MPCCPRLDALPRARLLLAFLAVLGCAEPDPTPTDAGEPTSADAAPGHDAGGVASESGPETETSDAGNGSLGDAAPDAADASAGELDASTPGTRDASADAVVTAADAAPEAGADAATPPRVCKRGVAYNREQAADAVQFGSALTWWYDWGSAPDAAALAALEARGAEFVPMIWTGPPRRDIDVQGLIRSIPKSARYLLGFNEPNFGAQANLTPEQAAAAWPKLEEIARARNLKLVSPAPNYCGGNCNHTDPFAWLDAFFAACQGCQVDYVAFHWYACSIEALRSIVGRYESKYQKPVWITELACLDDPGDHSAAGQRAYMDKAVAFLESDPQVFRYAWFIGRSSPAGAIDLFAAPGALTPLGSAYLAYPGTCR